MWLLLFSIFDMVFCKDFSHFNDQIKHKAGNRFYLLSNNKKNHENSSNQTNVKGSFWVVKIFGWFKYLVIKEHSSGSVVHDMALYYTQYKHTKFA